MPTLLDLARIETPRGNFNGRDTLQIEGTSMLQAHDPERTEVGWELFSHRAYSEGNWKVVSLIEPYGTGE